MKSNEEVERNIHEALELDQYEVLRMTDFEIKISGEGISNKITEVLKNSAYSYSVDGDNIKITFLAYKNVVDHIKALFKRTELKSIDKYLYISIILRTKDFEYHTDFDFKAIPYNLSFAGDFDTNEPVKMEVWFKTGFWFNGSCPVSEPKED